MPLMIDVSSPVNGHCHDKVVGGVNTAGVYQYQCANVIYCSIKAGVAFIATSPQSG